MGQHWTKNKKIDLYKSKRICKVCKKLKHITSYYFVGGKKKNKVRSTMCKKCFCKKTGEFKKANKKKYAIMDLKGRLKRVYGITLGEYLVLIKKCNKKCSICKKKLNKKTLVVDHCHKKKKARNILCRDCNFGIGNFKENITFLNNAIKYLKKHKGIKDEKK